MNTISGGKTGRREAAKQKEKVRENKRYE